MNTLVLLHRFSFQVPLSTPSVFAVFISIVGIQIYKRDFLHIFCLNELNKTTGSFSRIVGFIPTGITCLYLSDWTPILSASIYIFFPAVKMSPCHLVNLFLSPKPDSWPGCGSTDHHLCQRESYWLLQTLHDPGHQHTVPQTKRHQSRCLLLPQPPHPGYLDVRAAGLSWSELCALCDSQVWMNFLV